MHIFLRGPRNIGKSTVIHQTLNILTAQAPIKPGGFFTWRGKEKDPRVYMRPALNEKEEEIYPLAVYDPKTGGFECDLRIFEETGVSLLAAANADILIMDELGFLESKAPAFKRAVLTALKGSIPILGVLRLGDIPWHKEIISLPAVRLCAVNEKNRGELPRKLAAELAASLNIKSML